MNADCRTTAALTALADLERACDGPPPWGAVDSVLHGGADRNERLRHMAAQRQHERFAGQTRLAVARRRAVVGDGRKAEADPWLERLVQTLATHRDTARCLHDSAPRSVCPRRDTPRGGGLDLDWI